MDIELQPQQLLQSRTRKPQLTPKKQQPINHQSVIGQLNQTINTTFRKLQASYTSNSSSNESYLLKCYVKILDKILDELLYAQEKVQMVDCEDIKDEKCVAYLEDIHAYRAQCYQTKSEIETKKQALQQQRKITQKMEWDYLNMELLCSKKDKEINTFKEIIKEKQSNGDKTKSKISTIIEDNEKQSDLSKSQKKFQENQDTRDSNKTKNIKLLIDKRKISTTSNTMRIRIKSKIQSINQIGQNKSLSQPHSIRQRLQKKQKSLNKLYSNEQVTKQIDLCPQLGDNFKVMASPLWLYQPSCRKSKLLNKNMMEILVPKLTYMYNKQERHSNKESTSTSQESSRRDRQFQKIKRDHIFNRSGN